MMAAKKSAKQTISRKEWMKRFAGSDGDVRVIKPAPKKTKKK